MPIVQLVSAAELSGEANPEDCLLLRKMVMAEVSPQFKRVTLCSGFDGANSLSGNVYAPKGEYIEEGLMDALTASEWEQIRPQGLLDVARYALMHSVPAIGIYQKCYFNKVSAHSYRIKPKTTIVDACEKVFVWC